MHTHVTHTQLRFSETLNLCVCVCVCVCVDGPSVLGVFFKWVIMCKCSCNDVLPFTNVPIKRFSLGHDCVPRDCVMDAEDWPLGQKDNVNEPAPVSPVLFF